MRKVPETAILVCLAYGLTAVVTGLRTFGQEQLLYLTREAQAGLPVASWVLGHMLWDVVLQVRGTKAAVARATAMQRAKGGGGGLPQSSCAFMLMSMQEMRRCMWLLFQRSWSPHCTALDGWKCCVRCALCAVCVCGCGLPHRSPLSPEQLCSTCAPLPCTGSK